MTNASIEAFRQATESGVVVGFDIETQTMDLRVIQSEEQLREVRDEIDEVLDE